MLISKVSAAFCTSLALKESPLRCHQQSPEDSVTIIGVGLLVIGMGLFICLVCACVCMCVSALQNSILHFHIFADMCVCVRTNEVIF